MRTKGNLRSFFVFNIKKSEVDKTQRVLSTSLEILINVVKKSGNEGMLELKAPEIS